MEPLGASIRAKPLEADRNDRANGLLRQASQDENVHARPGGGHAVEHPARMHGLVLDIVLGPHRGVHWNKIVGPGHLHPVTRIVKKPKVCAAQLAVKGEYGIFHLPLPGIGQQGDLESEPA